MGGAVAASRGEATDVVREVREGEEGPGARTHLKTRCPS